MQTSTDQSKREILLGFAAATVSVASILPLLWGLFIFGDYDPLERLADPFPGFLRVAAITSLAISVIGAFCIGPFWRLPSIKLGWAAAGPYLVLAILSGNWGGIAVFAGTGFLVLGIYRGANRIFRSAARSGVVLES